MNLDPRKRPVMPIYGIDDWEKRLDRQDAFWHNEIIDRPVIHLVQPRPEPVVPWPAARQYDAFRDYWFDVDRYVAQAVAAAKNMLFLGDALPSTFPNIGPEVFSAFFGMELDYSDTTAYGIPNLHDWADADKVQFSRDNVYWRHLLRLTEALVEAGRGLFYTGYTDLHPGGDCIAAFRDPAELNMDLLLHPDEVRAMQPRVDAAFAETFDFFTGLLLEQRQAITSWPGVVSRYRWHVASNDFSCMISKEMFDDFFLPGIAWECRHAEASLYHLDGPGALRHLDSLLAIPELNAIQWVYGSGNGTSNDWIEVYRKCQAAGKGLQLPGITPDEVPALVENLRPEGVWLSVYAPDAAASEHVLKLVSGWR
jgi:hypothetical protein